MSNFEIGVYSIVAVLVIIQTGMHIAIAMMLVSFIGVWAIKGSAVAGKLLALSAAEKIASYAFGVIPLFVMMGLLVAAGDIGKDTFSAASRLLHRLKGGLAMSTVGANAVFAAVTGSSIASASVFTKVAVPEMVRHNYQPRFAVGVVAGSSVLGMLIPPSMLMIIYGIVTETSIGDLFIAGIIPGLLLALSFILLILFMAIRSPEKVWTEDYAAIKDDVHEDESMFLVWMKLLPIGLLMAMVVGGIYGGFFTPTEAGGVGTFGALIIGVVRRKLNFQKLWGVAIETGYVTASICFLLIAAQLYASMLAMSGVPSQTAALIAEADFSYVTIILGYVLLVLILGTFLESVSIMLILLPFVVPLLAVFGSDLIWFGIVTVLACEVGLLTPPLGLACFVIKANLQDSRIQLIDVFAGAIPFMLVMLLVLALIVAVPELSLMLL
ncbi:TRAP transporter large permease (plasmid) [Leisingera sp. M527]|uniref:TRAP transporter large permease n=1 Tax=Leisingera sp. M527 TaxID=2867014 RepID=UPI0021A31CFD|nr:TRAP transporter large permease [Leisingera sp. M527]UWQ35449.1 TRAP transporter large permease [Leisingera sp. M527]